MVYELVHICCQRNVCEKEHTSFCLGSWVLRQLLGLTAQLGDDPVIFVAIDFGGIPNIGPDLTLNSNSEVGLALLDMKDFTSSFIPSNRLISTQNFISGSDQHQILRDIKFFFENSIPIKQIDMLEAIKAFIPQDRRVVLVGQDIKNELRVLQRLGFEFLLYYMTALDTLSLCETVLGSKLGLGRLLRKLGCPAMNLHCSGNDANFALRAMLLLAIHGIHEQPEMTKGLAKLKEIAFSPPLAFIQLCHYAETLERDRDSQTRVARKQAKKLLRRVKLTRDL